MSGLVQFACIFCVVRCYLYGKKVLLNFELENGWLFMNILLSWGNYVQFATTVHAIQLYDNSFPTYVVNLQWFTYSIPDPNTAATLQSSRSGSESRKKFRIQIRQRLYIKSSRSGSGWRTKFWTRIQLVPDPTLSFLKHI